MDRALFLFLNGLNRPYTDAFWLAATSHWAWVLFFVPAAYFLFKKFGKNSLIPVLCVPLLFLLADQGTNIAKAFFERPRPCRAEDLQGLVYFIAPRCSPYGFWSAHSANAFAQLTFFICLGIVPAGNLRRVVYAYFIFFGVMVGLSRIMVGVHYPGDILAGAVYGTLCGLTVYGGYRWAVKKIYNRGQRPGA